MGHSFQSENQVSVYYDGLCYLCSFEISHYKSMKGAESIRWIDITSQDFDAVRENVDPFEVHQTLHVKDSQGHLHKGVDAFIQIWKQLPALGGVAKVASARPVKCLLDKVYAGFAKVRPHLPRRSCENSPYCNVK